MPTDQEFAAMETYLDVMKPLVKITEALGGQKWVTISTLRPLIHKLHSKYLAPCSDDNRLAKMLHSKMLANFKTRYLGEKTLLLNKATFLDPRIKSLDYVSVKKRVLLS